MIRAVPGGRSMELRARWAPDRALACRATRAAVNWQAPHRHFPGSQLDLSRHHSDTDAGLHAGAE
jgi:hypothetical protein